jgi:hypothetical protein
MEEEIFGVPFRATLGEIKARHLFAGNRECSQCRAPDREERLPATPVPMNAADVLPGQ